MKLLWVEWVDSNGFSEGTWVEREKITADALHVVSVGYLIKGSPTSIILASHIGLDISRKLENFTQASGIIEIPIQAIISVRTLSKGRKTCLAPEQSSPSSIPSLEESPDSSTTKPKSN